MSVEPLISVVVCTHNRADLLGGLLSSIEAQTLDKEQFEVVVVDNNSVDHTLQVAREFVARHINAQLFTESEQGLSNARNRGWREARGLYVAYIDDDAEADSHWLVEMASFIRRNPTVCAFGGPYEAFSTYPVPSWFPPGEGSMSLGSDERPLDAEREFIHGTNMVFRRDILAEFDGFDPALGMNGNKLSYGEETRFQLLLKERGQAVFYVPAMKVRHYLPAHKMRLGWLLKSAYAVGRCSALALGHRRGLFSHLAGIAYGCVHALRTFCRPRNIPLRRLIYYGLTPLVSEFGAFLDYFLRAELYPRQKQII